MYQNYTEKIRVSAQYIECLEHCPIFPMNSFSQACTTHDVAKFLSKSSKENSNVQIHPGIVNVNNSFVSMKQIRLRVLPIH